MGDFNDFQFSETLEILEGSRARQPDGDPAGRTSSTRTCSTATRRCSTRSWSRTELLTPKPEYDSVHVNAEFADQASDHDPQVARVVVRGTGNANGQSAAPEQLRPGRDRGAAAGTDLTDELWEKLLGARGRGAGGGLRDGRGRSGRTCSGAAPVSIHWTSAAGSAAWPSRGSRRTDSRRSLPKRMTDTRVGRDVEAVAAGEPLGGGERAAGRSAPAIEHELRRVARHGGREGLVHRLELRRRRAPRRRPRPAARGRAATRRCRR